MATGAWAGGSLATAAVGASGTAAGCTFTSGTTGAAGAAGASTRTSRNSSGRLKSIGRNTTASAINTRAPTMRCLKTLSSKAIDGYLQAVSLEPLQGIGDTIERSEHQYLVVGARLLALVGQGILDTAM